MRDPAVAEADQVVDGLAQALVVGGADDVDGAVRGPPRATTTTGSRAASSARSAVGQLRAEQDQRLAAVLQQARRPRAARRGPG